MGSQWGTVDEIRAAMLALAVQGAAKPTAPVRARVHTVRDLLEYWVAAVEDDLSLRPGTRVNARRCGRHLARTIGDVHIASAATCLDEHRAQRSREGAAASTIRLEAGVLITAWRWAARRGLVPTGAPERPRVAHRPVRSRYTPTADDVAAILHALRDAPPWVTVSLRLLWSTGCRLGEIGQLRVADVDLVHGAIRVDGKTGPREVPVAASVLAHLRPFLADKAPAAAVWPVTWMTFRASLGPVYLARACDAAGIPHVIPHAFRRAVVDMLYEAGTDPGDAAALLGHTVAVALQRYRTSRMERRRAAVERAGLGALPGEVIDFAPRNSLRATSKNEGST